MIIKCQSVDPLPQTVEMFDFILAQHSHNWQRESRPMWVLLSELIPIAHAEPGDIKIDPTLLLVEACEERSYHDYCISCVINELCNQLVIDGKVDPRLYKLRIDFYEKTNNKTLALTPDFSRSTSVFSSDVNNCHNIYSYFKQFDLDYPNGITLDALLKGLKVDREKFDYKV